MKLINLCLLLVSSIAIASSGGGGNGTGPEIVCYGDILQPEKLDCYYNDDLDSPVDLVDRILIRIGEKSFTYKPISVEN